LSGKREGEKGKIIGHSLYSPLKSDEIMDPCPTREKNHPNNLKQEGYEGPGDWDPR
jgi:hypothetical protein